MVKLVSVFDSQMKAGRAVDRLAELDAKDLETEVIENAARPYSDDPNRVKMAPPVPGTSASLHTPATFVGEEDIFSGLGLPEDEAAYFRRQAQKGAVLVVVKAAKEHEAQVRAIFEEEGGRFHAPA